MAYDEDVANRVREALAKQDGVDEKKMFGGLAFMVRGHMCCGAMGDEMMVRVGPDQYEECLAQPSRPQDGFHRQADAWHDLCQPGGHRR